MVHPQRIDQLLALNRTFLSVPESVGPEHRAASPYRTLFAARVEWDSLLEDAFVVVLGESGTGKTTEFKLCTQIVPKRRRSAFFLGNC